MLASGVTLVGDSLGGSAFATVAAGQDIDVPAAGFEETGEGDDDGGFSGAARGEAADAEDGPGQLAFAPDA